MFRKFLLTEDPVDLRNYNRFKRKLSKRKKRKKRAYFRELIKEANSKKDFKKTWQAINKVLNNGKKKLISPSDVMYSCIDTIHRLGYLLSGSWFFVIFSDEGVDED